jgi:hypothetical protein
VRWPRTIAAFTPGPALGRGVCYCQNVVCKSPPPGLVGRIRRVLAGSGPWQAVRWGCTNDGAGQVNVGEHRADRGSNLARFLRLPLAMHGTADMYQNKWSIGRQP